MIERHNEARDVLHIDPERRLYACSDADLNSLTNTSNFFKDFCLTSLGIGLPCVINAIPELMKPEFDPTTGVFLNSLIGLGGIVFGVVFGFLWHRSNKDTDALMA